MKINLAIRHIALTVAAVVAIGASAQVSVIPSKQATKPSRTQMLGLRPRVDGQMSLHVMPLPGASPFVHEAPVDPTQPVIDAKKSAQSITVKASDSETVTFNYMELYDNSWVSAYNFGIFQLETPSLNRSQLASGDAYYSADFAATVGDYLYTSVPLSDGAAFHYVIDLTTYSQLSCTYGAMIKALSSAVDRSSGTVYVCTLGSDGTEYSLGIFDPSSFSVSTTIGSFGTTGMAAMGCNRTGDLYGITTNGVLYKIDKTDASLTKVKATGLSSSYNTSGCFDLKKNVFYYCHFASASQSNLYSINADTGKATLLCAIPNCAEVQGLWIEAPPYDDASPDSPTDFNVSYVDDALTGTVSFTMPTTYFSGDAPAEGSTIEYSLYYNDALAGSGTAGYGDAVSIDVDAVSRGSYTIRLRLKDVATDEYGPDTSVTRYIGYDDVTDITNASFVATDDQFKVSWTAPTATNGGYYNPADLSYDVTRYPDNLVVATDYKSTSLTFEVGDETPTGQYYFGIVLHYYDPDSGSYATRDEVLTNVRVRGAYEVPVNYDFSDATEASQVFTVEDNNGDDITWTFVAGGAQISYNDTQAMDDWLISMPIHLLKDNVYLITTDPSSTNATNYPEAAEIFIGTAPSSAAMTTCLMEKTTLTESTTQELLFAPTEEGTYYIGIHGCSAADMYVLYVTSLTVEQLGTIDAPAPATNLTLEANYDNDQHAADVAFDAPTTTYAGNALTTIDRIELYRNGSLIQTYENPSPGEHFTLHEELTESRNHLYSVRAYNENGCGGIASGSVYVGYFAPLAISKVNIGAPDDDNSVRLWWDPVTRDIYGHNINRTMWYQPMVVYPNGAQQTAENGIYAGTTFTNTNVHEKYAAMSNGSYDATVNDQFLVFYYINNYYYEGTGLWQGTCHSAGPAYTGYFPVGKAYSLPYKESFADGATSTLFNMETYDTDGSWNITSESYFAPSASPYDGDGGMLIFSPQYLGDKASLVSGRLSLREATIPRISLQYYAVEGSEDQLSLEIEYNGARETIGTVTLGQTGTSGWTKAIFNLDKYAGKPVRYLVTGYCVNGISTILVDDIEAYDSDENNLAVTSIAAPINSRCDKEMQVVATILNNGHEAFEGYAATLYANGKAIDEREGIALEHGESETLTFTLTPGVAFGKSIDFYVEIVANGDEIADDNRSETATTSIYIPAYPVISDLQAEADNATVNLSWSIPTVEGDFHDSTTDDVESYVAFSIGLSTSELGDDDFIGDWTMVDADGNETYQMLSVDFANNHDDGAQKAWMVFNLDKSGIADKYPSYASDYTALSGKQAFICVAAEPALNNEGKMVGNDDWLISPKLSGFEQALTFNARAVSDAYGDEQYEVLYSTTTPEIEQFTKLGEKSVSNQWTADSYTLPEGAKYFAIRCVSYDVWALMIDDLTFEAGLDEPLALNGFNIYRDSEQIDTVTADTAQYTQTDVEDGTYTYNVTAIYNLGESALSNDAVITLGKSGIDSVTQGDVTISVANKVITIDGADGQQIVIVNAGGRCVASTIGSGHDTFAVALGVYIVNVGDLTVKVIAN